MARLRPLPFLVTALFVVQGCGGDAGPDGAALERGAFSRTDSAGIEIVTTPIGASAPVCGLAGEPVRIGSSEGDEASALFAVEDALRLPDGRIAVSLDGGDPTVAIFDETGAALARWGRRGEGPGEFKDTWRIWTHHDTLIVLDLRPLEFHYFDSSGAWVRTAQLDPVVFERPNFVFPLHGGGGFVSETQPSSFATPPNGIDEEPTVARFGTGGALVDTLGTFWKRRRVWTDPEEGYTNIPVFGALAAMVPAGEGHVAYASGRELQLEILELDGALRRIIRWESRDRSVRPADVETFKRDLRRRFEATGGPSPRTEAAIARETGDHRPVAERFPAHRQVLSTAEGRLWVEDYRRPLDQGPASWFVFESDGAFVCRVSVPDGWRALSVGAEHLVATIRDDFDVEYVLVQAIDAPEAGR